MQRQLFSSLCQEKLDKSFIRVRNSGFDPQSRFYFQSRFPEVTQKKETKLKLGQGQLDIEVTVTNLK